MGETAGSTAVTLLASQMPQHTHTITAAQGSLAPNRSTDPSGRVWSNEPKATPQHPPYMNTQPDTLLAPFSLSPAGGNQAHENRPPFLVVSFCIAMVGVFPSRN
jgi:microcystin-dependent protein